MENEEDESLEETITDNDEAEEEAEFDGEEISREVVVPGEVLTEDTKNFSPGRGTILNKERTKIISLNIGLKQINKNYINVIPLKGFYTPRAGDKVIALVTDKNPVKYRLDINAKDDGILKPKNTVKRNKTRGFRGGGSDSAAPSTDKYQIGDILIVKVLSADRLNQPELTTVGQYLGKRRDGIVISINPKSNIFVTQNGRIWLKGENIAYERLLIDAIKKIEREAHTVGLTDRISEYIDNEKKIRGIN
jgi:exosome complex component RRP4